VQLAPQLLGPSENPPEQPHTASQWHCLPTHQQIFKHSKLRNSTKIQGWEHLKQQLQPKELYLTEEHHKSVISNTYKLSNIKEFKSKDFSLSYAFCYDHSSWLLPSKPE
jgi:hypothetical protein